MDLRTTTKWLLTAPDVGTWIKLADQYIQAYNKMPEQFVLPAAHSKLQPIIAAFANSPSAFVDYIRALRDGSEGLAYDDLHALYRTISVRVLQVVRRTRVRNAVLLNQPDIEAFIGRSINYDEQIEVGKFFEEEWGRDRMEAMEKERMLRRNHRLNTEERATLLEDFWRDLDQRIENKELKLTDDEMKIIAMRLGTPKR